MHSSLVVTVPADTTSLLTIQECRAALGISNSSQDAALKAAEKAISAAIIDYCGVAVGKGAPPTLWQETLTETFRDVDAEALILSRRHDVQIVTLLENGEPLDGAAFEADPESGLVARLADDCPLRWRARKVEVTYQAGFDDESMPANLKQAAADFLRFAWANKERDSTLKSEVIDIPDVRRIERSYWVGAVPGQSGGAQVPDMVAGQLARFRNVAAF